GRKNAPAASCSRSWMRIGVSPGAAKAFAPLACSSKPLAVAQPGRAERLGEIKSMTTSPLCGAGSGWVKHALMSGLSGVASERNEAGIGDMYLRGKFGPVADIAAD